jgi:hypothetical protein
MDRPLRGTIHIRADPAADKAPGRSLAARGNRIDHSVKAGARKAFAALA